MNQQGFDASGGASALKNLFAHFDRTKIFDPETGEHRYVPYMNLTQRGSDKSYNWSEIDETRTHLNYNLAPERDISQAEFLTKRLSEIYVHKSALKNALVDWVVTLPDLEQYEGHDREFFEVVYDALAEKYGHENVVSAYVHMDENQPHMHFAFVPVAEDEKHEQGFKLSKKAVNTCERVVEDQETGKKVVKVDTREFSKQAHEYVEKRVCERMNFKNAGVVLTPEQIAKRKIKQNMKVRELVIAGKELDRLEAAKQKTQIELDCLSKQRDKIAAEITSEAARLESVRQRADCVEATYSKVCELENQGRFGFIAKVREFIAWIGSRTAELERTNRGLRERVDGLEKQLKALRAPTMSLSDRINPARDLSRQRASRSYERGYEAGMEL